MNSSIQSSREAFVASLGSPAPESGPQRKPGVWIPALGKDSVLLGNPSFLQENFLSLSLPSGRLGLPPPPFPIEFLASGSWRQLGRPTNFSPGHFLTPPPPPSAFFSSPRAPFERRHPGPERVLQFNYFQILCSGHPGTPLSAIESWGRRSPAGGPESIRPLLGSLPPIEAPAKPGLLAPSGPLHSRAQLPFLEASVESAQGYMGLSPSGGNGRRCRPSMILADPVPACGFSPWGLPRPCRLPRGAAFEEAAVSASGLGSEGTASTHRCDFATLPCSPATRISLPLFPPGPDPQLPVGSSLS